MSAVHTVHLYTLCTRNVSFLASTYKHTYICESEQCKSVCACADILYVRMYIGDMDVCRCQQLRVGKQADKSTCTQAAVENNYI